MFASSMKRASVGISKMRVRQGLTGVTQLVPAPLLSSLKHLARARACCHKKHDCTNKISEQQQFAGRCVILSCNGQRTMRTCLGDATRLAAEDLTLKDLQGAKWLLLSGYGFYGQGLLQRAAQLASEGSIKVALDLASFEIVKRFRVELLALLQSGLIHCCFCNEVNCFP